MLEAWDLSQSEIDGVARRVMSALQRRPLLTLQSLQYRLGETGQQRIHPYKLHRALQTLSQKSGTNAGALFHEAEPYLFVSAELEDTKVSALRSDLNSDITHIADCDWKAGFAGFTEALANHVGELYPIPARPTPAAAPLSDTRAVDGQSQVFHTAPKGVPAVYVWVTQEPQWLISDDPRLWEMVEYCRDRDARLLVLARYIDPASFVLFKALGIRGLQFYNMWAPPAVSARMRTASDRIGWYNVKGSPEGHSHKVLGQVRSALTHLQGYPWTAEISAAVDLARDIGMTTATQPVIAELVCWAERCPLDVPRNWINTLRRHLAWKSDIPLAITASDLTVAKQSRRRGKPTGPEAPPTVQQTTSGQPPMTTVSRVPVRGW